MGVLLPYLNCDAQWDKMCFEVMSDFLGGSISEGVFNLISKPECMIG